MFVMNSPPFRQAPAIQSIIRPEFRDRSRSCQLPVADRAGTIHSYFTLLQSRSMKTL
jgi:hypothetical protein